MVMAVTKQEEPAIKVDDSRKYRINAGNCDKCGYFKSWDFKITNPKTGKQIPGHVTKEGFKINDGDCPFYALLKAKGDAKETKEGRTEVQPKTTPEPTKVKMSKPTRSSAPGQKAMLSFSINGDSIITTLGACSTMLTKEDAIRVCRDLLSLLIV